MNTFRFNQSDLCRRDIILHGEFVGSCPVAVDYDTPLGTRTGTASLYRTLASGDDLRYVGVIDIPSLTYVDAQRFEPISTDEMEGFFGKDAAFQLFKLADMAEFTFIGECPSNKEGVL